MTKLVRVTAWATVIISLLVVFLSLAPFTAAVFSTALLLPIAAFTAWNRALLPSAITVLQCVLAFFVSPLTLSDLLEFKPLMAWLFICLVAVAAGFYVGSRSRDQATA